MNLCIFAKLFAKRVESACANVCADGENSKIIGNMNGRKIGSLVLVLSLVIVAASVLFTNNLARQLAQEEQKNVEVWAEATRQLILADEDTDIDFVTSIIENNTTIPVYMVDEDGKILVCRNVEQPVDDPRTLSGPIELRISPNNVQYIYYDESNLLRQLRYVPYIQFALIFIFIAIAVVMMLTAQRSEQNRVWVGLSKETAHQLGTPISSLNAWQELLSERYPNDELIPQMKTDIDRLHTIADRFSKIGSEPELQETDIVQPLRDTINYMRSRVSKKVEIVAMLPSEECLLMLNVPLFEWVIENLIKNAVDAMSGVGKITIDMQQKEEGEVWIDISDTGKGMDKHTLRRIFQAGFSTKQRGWGLGLPLSKRIIEEYHGGRLFVKSTKPGGGTTFRIVLK